MKFGGYLDQDQPCFALLCAAELASSCARRQRPEADPTVHTASLLDKIPRLALRNPTLQTVRPPLREAENLGSRPAQPLSREAAVLRVPGFTGFRLRTSR